MFEELDDKSVADLIRTFDGVGPYFDSDGEVVDAYLFFTEVADRLSGRGAEGSEALIGLLQTTTSVQSERFAALLFGLASIARLPEPVIRQIRNCVMHSVALVAAAAIDCLRRRRDPDVEPQVRARFSSGPAEVTAEALKYLVSLKLEQVRSDFRAALNHPSAVVRFAAVNLIDDWRSDDLLAEAQQLVNDPDDDVRAIVLGYLHSD